MNWDKVIPIDKRNENWSYFNRVWSIIGEKFIEKIFLYDITGLPKVLDKIAPILGICHRGFLHAMKGLKISELTHRTQDRRKKGEEVCIARVEVGTRNMITIEDHSRGLWARYL